MQNKKKKIRFQYFDYGADGKKAVRHNGERYIISPYDLIWSNDTYYLAGLHEAKGIAAKFRVDRMKGLEVTEDKALSKPKGYSVAKFFSQEFSMLGGEPCKVTLLCENGLMNSVVDHFGRKVSTKVVDSDHFSVTVSVDLSGVFYGWVFASGGKMQILSPAQAADGFNEIVKKYRQ